MSNNGKVMLHIRVEASLYDRLYAHSRDTGEKFVSVLKRALEKELAQAGDTDEPAYQD